MNLKTMTFNQLLTLWLQSTLIAFEMALYDHWLDLQAYAERLLPT